MSKPRKTHNFLQDEQGDWSLARLSLTVTLGFTLALIVVNVLGGVSVPEIVYGLLEAVIVAEAAWAGAPRAMRYVRQRGGGFGGSITARPPEDITP